MYQINYFYHETKLSCYHFRNIYYLNQQIPEFKV